LWPVPPHYVARSLRRAERLHEGVCPAVRKKGLTLPASRRNGPQFTYPCTNSADALAPEGAKVGGRRRRESGTGWAAGVSGFDKAFRSGESLDAIILRQNDRVTYAPAAS
jgi:hypothetical protein